MAERDYTDLKARIEDLIDSIEKIDQEATSFADARAELVVISEKLSEICSDLSITIKTSGEVLDQVKAVAVSNTLETIQRTAEQFGKVGDHILSSLQDVIRESVDRFVSSTTELGNKVDTAREKQTLEFQESVNQFNKAGEYIINSSERIMQETVDKFVVATKELVNKIDNTSEKQTVVFQETTNAMITNLQKKVYILGGSAIVCAITALILALAF
jgi:ElaB/YqjD/DUF883 family membrane-anchored ribosome-binding protein